MSIMQFPTQTGAPLLRPAFSLSLAGGQSLMLPPGQGANGLFSTYPGQIGFVLSGQYHMNLGRYLDFQYLDPVLSVWRSFQPEKSIVTSVFSDTSNFRIANTTGCPIGAVITNTGSGLTNGFNTVTVTPSVGGSTWNTIVGGTINSTITITSGGSNYTLPPALVFNPPAAQGNTPYILPTATCTIAAGAINAVTVFNQGAGLVAAPTIRVIPNPFDVTGAGAVLTVNSTLTNSGALVWMGAAQYGTALSSNPTFTFSPASTIAATAIMNFTVTGFTIGTAGAGLGAGLPLSITSGGGIQPAVPAALNPGNPDYDFGMIKPRAAYISANSTAGGIAQNAGSVIIDAGYGFQTGPTLFVTPTNLPTQWPVLNATVGATTGHLELLPI